METLSLTINCWEDFLTPVKSLVPYDISRLETSGFCIYVNVLLMYLSWKNKYILHIYHFDEMISYRCLHSVCYVINTANIHHFAIFVFFLNIVLTYDLLAKKFFTLWENSFVTYRDKIHIFWEGHKILQNLHLTFVQYVVPVKSKVEISQNFVAFSKYMNFKKIDPLPGPSAS